MTSRPITSNTRPRRVVRDKLRWAYRGMRRCLQNQTAHRINWLTGLAELHTLRGPRRTARMIANRPRRAHFIRAHRLIPAFTVTFLP